MGCKPNQILVGYTHKFVSLLNQHTCRHVIIVDQRLCSQAGAYISPLILCNVYQYHKYQFIPLKALGRQQLFFMINDLCSCYLQQQSLAINLQRASISLGNSLDCLTVSIGNLWPITRLYVTHPSTRIFLQRLEISSQGSVSPIIQLFHLDCLNVYIYFRKTLLYQVHIGYFSCPLVLAVCPNIPSFTSLLHSCPHLLFLLLFPNPCIFLSIYFISPSQGDLSVLPTPLLYS